MAEESTPYTNSVCISPVPSCPPRRSLKLCMSLITSPLSVHSDMYASRSCVGTIYVPMVSILLLALKLNVVVLVFEEDC